MLRKPNHLVLYRDVLFRKYRKKDWFSNDLRTEIFICSKCMWGNGNNCPIKNIPVSFLDRPCRELDDDKEAL